MELKDKLSQLRKGKGLTQQKLAELLYVSRQTVSRWEVGTSLPTLENLVSLSELYQIPLDELAHDQLKEPAEAPSPPAGHSGPKLHLPRRGLVLAVLGLVLLAGAVSLYSIQTAERSPIMDIINAVRAGVYRPVQSAAARTTEVGADSFTEQAKGYYGVSGNGKYTVILSPAVKLRLDYNKWKETQPPQEDIPNPQGGPTEENLAYLRERYSGDLTMFRKMEALDTMYDMGIITREQQNYFYGIQEKIWTTGDLGIRSSPLEEGFMSQEARLEQELYRLSPLAKSVTLDDLFSWLDN